MNRLLFATATLATCVPALAQTTYWIANRSSSDIMRVSEWGTVRERVATPTTLRGCTTAPDGKVWVVRFIQQTFDIYDPLTATFTPVTLPSGSAYAIAFDAAGHGWVTNGGTAVHEYDAAGTFVQTYTTVAGAALGITIDALGNKWIAHRVTPASVSRIDPTGAVTNFPIVGTTTMLPVGVVADYRGILQPSHIWVTGDSSSQLAELDGTTGATLNLYTVPFGSLANPATFDLAGRIWVSSFGVGTVVQIDQATGSVLTSMTLGPNNIGITTDNHGRIRTTARTTTPPCETRRLNPVTGALEIPTLLQFGAFNANGTQWQLSTQFQHCLVANQLGDNDNDGEANLTEILGGSSPVDAASTTNFRVESFGTTQNGSTPTFEVIATPATLWLVGFALAEIPPTPIPGFGGVLQIDPLSLVLTSAGVGNASLPIVIPADPTLAGFEFFAQGIAFNGLGFDFKNFTGMKVW
ncbi:MAG TPA: hypothetical protein VF384_18740 [Planctomycetota bacterium]